MFVNAARVMGARRCASSLRHVAAHGRADADDHGDRSSSPSSCWPSSALSFLGIGIQPPEVTWGLMVAQGRNYLGTAWWLAFFPGLAIMLTTLAAQPALGLAADRDRPACSAGGWRREATRWLSRDHLLEVRDLVGRVPHRAGHGARAVRDVELAPRSRRDAGASWARAARARASARRRSWTSWTARRATSRGGRDAARGQGSAEDERGRAAPDQWRAGSR